MPKFNFKFQSLEHYVENIEIEADTFELADKEAHRLLEDGEVSFDGEACHFAESVAAASDIWLDTAMSSPNILDDEFNPRVNGDVSVLRDPPLLSGDQVRSALKPQLGELWDACIQCIDDPDDNNFDKFRQLCRPAEIMLLLRVWAENNREDRDVCSRSL